MLKIHEISSLKKYGLILNNLCSLKYTQLFPSLLLHIYMNSRVTNLKNGRKLKLHWPVGHLLGADNARHPPPLSRGLISAHYTQLNYFSIPPGKICGKFSRGNTDRKCRRRIVVSTRGEDTVTAVIVVQLQVRSGHGGRGSVRTGQGAAGMGRLTVCAILILDGIMTDCVRKGINI